VQGVVGAEVAAYNKDLARTKLTEVSGGSVSQDGSEKGHAEAVSELFALAEKLCSSALEGSALVGGQYEKSTHVDISTDGV
jgi:hypothetical protein